MAGLYGSGDMYFNLINPATNLPGGWSGKIYTSAFSIETPGELSELLSKGRDDFNTVIGAVGVKQPDALSFSLNGGDLEMYRLAWLGTVGALTQAATPVVAELVRVPVGAARFRVVRSQISAVTVTSSPAGTTYVAGTDFLLENARMGLFAVIPGSSLATAVAAGTGPGLALLVSYTPAVISGTRILGAVNPAILGEIFFDGLNQESQKSFEISIPRAVITPQGGIDILNEGFTEAQFNARLVKLPGQAAPFTANFPTGA